MDSKEQPPQWVTKFSESDNETIIVARLFTNEGDSYGSDNEYVNELISLVGKMAELLDQMEQQAQG